jgi:hypothetical protein
MQFMKLLLSNFLQPPVTSSHFDPKILFRFLFSSILNEFCFPNVKDQISHPST